MIQDLIQNYCQPLKHSMTTFHNIIWRKKFLIATKAMNIESLNKNFFTNNLIADIFVFAAAIIVALATIIILYLLCKHNRSRKLIASLVLHQIREVGTSEMKDDTNNVCSCTSQFYIILSLSVYIFGLVCCRFLILLIKSWSKLVITGTEHLVVCLLMLSRIMLIALILAWINF